MKQKLTLTFVFSLLCIVVSFGQKASTLELANSIRSGDFTLFQKQYSTKAVIGIDPVSGIRPLHLACKLGEIDFVNFMLKKEQSMETGVYVTKKEETPMIHAMKEGHLEVIQALINVGKLRAIDGWKNKTYLEHAIDYNCKPEVYRKLVDNGANVDQLIEEKSLLYHAAKNGNIKVVETLITLGANPNKIYMDYSPLGIAAKKGNAIVLEKMIENGADATKIASAQNETLSAIAIKNGQHDLLSFLEEEQSNARVTQKTPSTVDIAVEQKNWNLAEKLSASNDGSRLVHQGTKTLFMTAIEANDLSITKKMLNNNANVNLKTKAYTPLLIASQNNHFEMARLLIREGAIINVETSEGTPLEAAIWNNDVKMVQLLVDNGANLFYRNKRNETPLRFAKRYKRSPEVIKVLEIALDR